MAKQRHNILVLNGPNLNMLGLREPDVYGFKNLGVLALECEEYAANMNFAVDFRQTNIEGEMVDIIHQAREGYSGVVINPAAYGHTSIAIHDALKILDVPIIEVHLSNIYKRETFRHTSYVSPLAKGTITGFGGHGYIMALDAMRALLDDDDEEENKK